MKMNFEKFINNYANTKNNEIDIKKDFSTLSKIEKELNCIDIDYKENLFEKLLNLDNKKFKKENINNFSRNERNNKDHNIVYLKNIESKKLK